MAITEIHPITSTLNLAIDYITNPHTQVWYGKAAYRKCNQQRNYGGASEKKSSHRSRLGISSVHQN